MSKTMYERIWEQHVIHEDKSGMSVIYVDRHLIHEVTSPKISKCRIFKCSC